MKMKQKITENFKYAAFKWQKNVCIIILNSGYTYLQVGLYYLHL